MIYNEQLKKWVGNSPYIYRGIVYISHKYIEYGFFQKDYNCIPIIIDNKIYYLCNISNCHLPLYWDNVRGCYTLQYNNRILKEVSKTVFNYPIFKAYNLSKIDIKPTAINVELDNDYTYISKFTIGLEYETSKGNIPWLDCLNTNLVPLYDGSITGHEYVTFPLKYSDFGIIKKHLELLQEYTEYDKNCALHIHFGGFPIDYDLILKLCQFWYFFQKDLLKYIPCWSYAVELYKDNRKAYNKPFPKLQSLIPFYEKYTANFYKDNNSFYLPNNYDVDEQHKWNVVGRYFNMNIMHLISGDQHKTVEFRFLRPTYNYSELKWYILVLGAFLNYVVNSNNGKSQITVEGVINFSFPREIAYKLIAEGKKLYKLHKIQENSRDFAGVNESLKDLYLNQICKFKL